MASAFGIKFSDYEIAKTTTTFQVYVAAVGEGYLWANADLILRNQKPLYCAPPQTEFGAELFKAILAKRIHEHRSEIKPDTSIGLILLDGLQESYPCPQR